VAVRGHQADGHAFIDAAVRSGIPPGHRYPSAGCPVHAAQQIQHRCFAGAAGAQYNRKLTVPNFKIRMIYRPDRYFAHLVGLAYIFKDDIRHKIVPFHFS
jgi:hypothetical protein